MSARTSTSSPPDNHRVAADGIFGPGVRLLAYDDVGYALAAAKKTRCGLAGSAWGRDISTFLGLADQLEEGIAQINQDAVMVPGIASDGIKNSSLEALLESYF